MRQEQLEAWVLSVLDRVKAKQTVEDSRVELKAEWPHPSKAARRLAGHANASGGESVLWIIGIDENTGVVPLEPTEVADWYKQLNSRFDGLSPDVQDLIVPTVDGPLVALLFNTSRRPYVVKNPAYGVQEGDPVSHEVPWREGTAVRSARREDLLRILVPLQQLPHLELLDAAVDVREGELFKKECDYDQPPLAYVPHVVWNISLDIYITPKTSDLLVLPFHKGTLSFACPPEASATRLESIGFNVPPRYMGMDYGDYETVNVGEAGAIVRGPGKLGVRVSHLAEHQVVPSASALRIVLGLTPAGQEHPAELAARLHLKSQDGDYKRSWGQRTEKE